jgi:hypothetical protein
VPLVTYDGTAGGLSGDNRRLVLATHPPFPRRGGATRFAVLRTRGLRPLKLLRLKGSWSFDAVSPDGGTLYLTEHVKAGRHPLYRVRPLDVHTGRVGPAIVDRLEGERDMGGEPLKRAVTADGRWAYTLYARRGHGPFVHALDTVARRAYCIDLPLPLRYKAQWTLYLRLHERGRQLAVRRGRATLATVHIDSWRVSRL